MSGEKHTLLAAGTGLTADVMQGIYNFVNTNGSACGLRIASDGGTYATHNGSALGTPDGTVGWWATGANAYLVIEPVDAMPGGGRWQCKIIRNSTLVLQSVWAPNGGWTVASQSYAGLACSAVTQWNDGSAPGASCTHYISGSNLETYTAGNSTYGYTYFRIIGRRGGGTEDNQFVYGLYVGGYVPNEPTVDTKPSCMLARTPSLAGNALAWSYAVSNSNNLNRAPVDDVHTVTDYTNNGVCFASAQMPGVYAKSRSGKWCGKTIYLYNMAGSYELGQFGATYTMAGGYLSRADATPDGNNEYIVMNDMIMRWKPSA